MKRQTLPENRSSTAKRQKMAINLINEPPAASSKTICSTAKVLSLNDDCLRKIAEYLSIEDLLNMCIADNQLKNVLKHFVKGRLFDFDELDDCCHILDLFKVFGQQMTKIKIAGRNIQYKNRRLSDLDEILRLITMYCSKDALRCLEIQYIYGTCIDPHLMNASIPIFENIEKFKISEIYDDDDDADDEDVDTYFTDHIKYNPSVNDFVERVVENAANISSIELKNLRINGRFFHLDHICNLKTLTLIGCNVKEQNGLVSYIQKKPKLMSLTFVKTLVRGMDSAISASSKSVFELVANNVADLEALHYSSNYGYINDQNEYVDHSVNISPDFELLTKFDKLKTLTVNIITVDNFKILAQQNRIEQLSVERFPGAPQQIDWSFLQNFTSLKVIRLLSGPWVKYFILFLSKLPNLTECRLDSSTIFEDDIKNVVKSTKHLSILRISHSFGKLRTSLYLSLLILRLQQGPRENPLFIYVDKNIFDEVLSHLGHMYSPNIITLKRYDRDCY